MVGVNIWCTRRTCWVTHTLTSLTVYRTRLCVREYYRTRLCVRDPAYTPGTRFNFCCGWVTHEKSESCSRTAFRTVVQSVTFKSNKIKGLIGWAIQRLAFCEFVFNLEWTTWIQPLSSNTILCCHPFIFFDLLNWRLDVDIFPGLSRGIWNSCYSSYSKTFFLACQIILQKNGQKKQRLGSSSSLLTLKNLLGSSNILTQSWIGF